MRKLVVLLVCFTLAAPAFAQRHGGSRGGGIRSGGFRGGAGGARAFSRSYSGPRFGSSARNFGRYGSRYQSRGYYGGSRYYGGRYYNRGHYGRGFYRGYRPYYYYSFPSAWASSFGFGYSPYGWSYPYYPSYYYYGAPFYGYFSTWTDPYDPYAYSVSPPVAVPQSYAGDGQWHRFSEGSARLR